MLNLILTLRIKLIERNDQFMDNDRMRIITYPGVIENYYGITPDGEVINLYTGKPLIQYRDKDGYMRVSLRAENKKSKGVQTHRLVAWEYCENDDPKKKTQVDHLDGVKNHNDYTNLEWVTPRENTLRAERMGLRCVRGESNGNNKFSEGFVRALCKRLSNGESKMSIIRSLHPDKPLASDNRALYTMLDRLSKHQIWPDISKDYSFPKPIRQYTLPNKEGVVNSYGEEFIHFVCDLLNNGHSIKGTAHLICNFMNGDSDDARFKNAYQLANSIVKGYNWAHISSQYDNIDYQTPTSKFAFIDPVKVCKMHDEGYSNKEINKALGIRDGNNGVKRIIAQYRAIGKIAPRQDIEIKSV